jgi:predicted neuraminidase
MVDRSRRAVLASTALALWGVPARRQAALPRPGSPFVLPPPPAAAAPSFTESFIDHDPPLDYIHCPSLCPLPDGRLLCTWYAGSREGARDVAVFLAESTGGATVDRTAAGPVVWSPPRVVIDPRTATAELGRFVAKVGNAVIFADAAGRAWIVYVSIAVGGWSGSSLNACSSPDGGRTWSASQRLPLSPFFNISELVRAAPVHTADGTIGLPAYHECLGKFPEMLWLKADGERLLATKTRLAGGRAWLQPAVVPLDEQTALAFLRNHAQPRRLLVQRTDDAGKTWSPPADTSLPNPDASIAAVRLSSGAVLLAFNDSLHDRTNLRLAVSADGVGDWQRIATLAEEPGGSFGYPYMIQDAVGTVHLVHEWNKQRVRHLAFNEAWVAARREATA